MASRVAAPTVSPAAPGARPPSSSGPAGPTKARLPRAERRSQLIGAAATAFLRAGFDTTSMEDVAAAAGVTRLIVYRNFGTKEELYRAVLNAVTDRLVAEFEGVHETRSGAAGRILRVARAHPDGFRLLWRHAAHEPAFADEAAAFREVVTSYTEALIHPMVHDRTFRLWAASALVAHLYDGTCAWLDAGDETRDDEFVERMSEGLRALVTAWS